ncbi:MAG: ABC transporter ATP-binding protein [Erysipelothrix sp.]|jgi:ABC-type lipoprotein export system ATPase subunit|nr:ABC transporter ATP-binding protein [Erysipelothrix sp.]
MISSNKVIHLDSIYKSYGEKTILRNLNLSVYSQEFLGITGVSGSGKSTLMNILLGIEGYDSGYYTIMNLPLHSIKNFSRYRIDVISMIFQSSNLIKELTVRENILLPHIYWDKSKEIDHEQFDYVTDLLGIQSILNQTCNTLSGGEQQRVAIARCVYYRPQIIIADEPTGNLDIENTKSVVRILKELHKNGTTIILITHDIQLLEFCSRVLTLDGGFLT